jgi:hypothetical protein
MKKICPIMSIAAQKMVVADCANCAWGDWFQDGAKPHLGCAVNRLAHLLDIAAELSDIGYSLSVLENAENGRGDPQ